MNRPPLTDRDGEVRELTADDFKDMRPVENSDPEIIAAMRRYKERNEGGQPKIDAGFHLAADVVEGIKATGAGYDARVEAVLRDALDAGRLDADRDPAIRGR